MMKRFLRRLFPRQRQVKLAESAAGRALLHACAALANHHWRYHGRGLIRQLRG